MNVLLTGGSGGIGQAIRREFSRLGASVLAPSRRELELNDPKSMWNWLRSHPRWAPDIMILNAGINNPPGISFAEARKLEKHPAGKLRCQFLFDPKYGPQNDSERWRKNCVCEQYSGEKSTIRALCVFCFQGGARDVSAIHGC